LPGDLVMNKKMYNISSRC